MKYEEEVRCLLWLVMAFGAGSPKIWDVLRLYETPQRACEVLQSSEIERSLRLQEHTKRRIRQLRFSQVDDMLERCEKLHVSILWFGEDAYPEKLFAVVNPPVLLFYQGDLSLLQDHLLLTVVGTRNPTEYSLRVEKTICNDLVIENFVPVTGFAVGVDITANLCALAHDKPSIALTGCGLDVAYPAPHASLKARIAENGLILSEFVPGTEPKPANFPIRNRVLSGLTMGTLVIQAPARSGALITAECAMEQGRDVFCVPPADIFDKRYMGVIKYLRNGAVPVFDSRDIVYAYYTSHAHMIAASALYENQPEKSESLVMSLGEEPPEPRRRKKSKSKKSKPPQEEAPAPVQETQRSAEEDETPFSDESLDENAAAVLALLRKQVVMHVDHIAAETEIPMETLIMTLTELELYGKVERLPGKQFRVV